MKINIEKLLYIVSMITLLEPIGLYSNSSIHPIYSIGKICALLYAIYLILCRRIKLNNYLYYVIGYCVWMVIPTVINGGLIRVWFREFYMYTSVCVILQFWCRRNIKFAINILATIFSLTMFLNLITLFIEGIDFNDSAIIYLIGIRTRIGDWAFIALPITLLGAYLKEKRCDWKVIITVFSSLMFMIMNTVSASILCTMLMIIAIILNNVLIRYLKKLLVFIFPTSLIISILIIVFRIQNYFKWLIVDILGENLTLNSRTLIWDQVLLKISSSWLIGYGAGVERDFTVRLNEWSAIHATSTHNQFLAVVYDYGIIGFLFFTLLIICAIKKINNYKNSYVICIFASSFSIYCILMIPEIVCNSTGFYVLLTLIANIHSIPDNIKYKKLIGLN